MKQKLLVIIVLFLLGLAGFFVKYFYFQPDTALITATGMIEITLADVTPKVSGYLLERNFIEGSSVDSGAVIARINPRDYLLQLQEASAAYNNSLATLRDFEAGSRDAEIAYQRAALEASRLAMDKATVEYKRFDALYATGAIARQELDNSRLAMTSSIGQYKQVQASHALALEGSRKEQIVAQQHLVAQRLAAVHIAQAQLDYTQIYAPVSGRVLSKNYEVGEFINSGAPIATLGSMQDCWVKIYVPSTLLGKVRLDQQVIVRIDSYPDRTFTGVVREIATQAEFTPRQTITKEERANLVFAVKVYLDNSQEIFKPGMPAEVSIP